MGVTSRGPCSPRRRRAPGGRASCRSHPSRPWGCWRHRWGQGMLGAKWWWCWLGRLVDSWIYDPTGIIGGERQAPFRTISRYIILCSPCRGPMTLHTAFQAPTPAPTTGAVATWLKKSSVSSVFGLHVCARHPASGVKWVLWTCAGAQGRSDTRALSRRGGHHEFQVIIVKQTEQHPWIPFANRLHRSYDL